MRRIAAFVVVLVLLLPATAAGSPPPEETFVYLPMVLQPPEPACGQVRVFDYDGNEQDWDWLVETFGNVRVGAGDGSACLIELRAKRDDSTLVVKVVDSAGQPVNGIYVVFHWPDAPFLADQQHPELIWCYDRGVFGITGQRIEADPGTVGFGMGGGAFYCPPEGGPHTVWVGGPGSDCLYGLGMLCWTNHYHVNPTFMIP